MSELSTHPSVAANWLARLRETTPERLTQLGAVLIVVLSATLIAVTLAYRTSIEAERERASRGAIGVVSAIQGLFTDQSLRLAAGMLLEIFAPALAGERSPPEASLVKMQQRLQEYSSHCACTPMAPSAMLIIDASDRVHEARGDGLRPVSEAAVSAIRRVAAATRPGVQEYRAIRVEADEPALAYLQALQPADGAPYIAAIVVPVREMGEAVFEPTRRRILSQIYENVAGRDSLFGFLIMLGQDTVYRSAWLGNGPNWTVPFWTPGNPLLESTTVLNPSIMAAAIPGGIPNRQDGLIVTVIVMLVVMAGAAVYALRRASHLMMARTLFLTGISHELRTPLTQVLIYAERLGRAEGDPALLERAREVIVREARRLVHMIENVLLFSRGTGTRLPLNLRGESVGQLAVAALEDLAPLLTARDTAVETSIAPDSTAFVDGGAIRQILYNLIDNAIRHGPPGQTLIVGVEANATRVELFVDDEGPGFAPGDRDRAWRPFTSSGRGGGTGIGLSLVRRLATEMGGGADIRDGHRGGARVSAWFPRVVDATSPAAEADRQAQPGPAGATT